MGDPRTTTVKPEETRGRKKLLIASMAAAAVKARVDALWREVFG